MWAQRQRYVSLGHAVRVPSAVRAALQEGPRPPCPVSQYVLYQAAGGVTMVLSNPDSGTPVELYATPRPQQLGLLRGVVADLVAGFFGGGGWAGLDSASLAVQLFDAEGRHLVTAVRGVSAASSGGAVGSVDCTALVVVDCDEHGKPRYRHARTKRRRKRILFS